MGGAEAQKLGSLCRAMVDLLKGGLQRATAAHSSAAGSAHPLGGALVASDVEICEVIEPLIDQAARLAEALGYERPPIVRARLDVVAKRWHTHPELTRNLCCEAEVVDQCRELQGFIVFAPDDGTPTFAWTYGVLEGDESGRHPVQRCPRGQAVEQTIAGLTAWAVALGPVEREPRSDERTGGQLPPHLEKALRQYHTAIEKGNLGSKPTDRKAYDWYIRHCPGIPDVPHFETWQRYLRHARRFRGTQKNLPRGGRSYGGSVVRQRDVDVAREDDE